MNYFHISGIIFISSIVIVVAAILVKLTIRKLRQNDELKYEFVTVIAHKFRTPLSSVKWTNELLLSNEQDPFKRQSLENIKNLNEQLISLMGTLIELADSDNASKLTYHFERISLCDITRTIANTVRHSFKEKNISLNIQCADENIFVNVDTTRMEFVLQTLFENSCIYTPIGGKVDIFIEGNKDKALVTLIDNGIGIEKSDLPYIFSKFYRAKNALSFDTEGLGVGLYLARSIANRLSGKITVDSPGKDRGSTFVLTLPRVK